VKCILGSMHPTLFEPQTFTAPGPLAGTTGTARKNASAKIAATMTANLVCLRIRAFLGPNLINTFVRAVPKALHISRFFQGDELTDIARAWQIYCVEFVTVVILKYRSLARRL
jgi:hypothetical protein